MAETDTQFERELGAENLPDPREVTRRRHPSAREYIRIGLILAALTGLEVWMSYSSLPHGLLITLLSIASAIKFALVALWFMHLRFDSPIFRRLFVTGLLLAISVYMIVLLTFRVFIR